MQITLDHSEIEKAIKQYVVTHAMPQPNAQISITMKAGRGERGYSCIVNIVPLGVSNPVSEKEVVDKPAKVSKTTLGTVAPPAKVEVAAEPADTDPADEAAEEAGGEDQGGAAAAPTRASIFNN